MAFPEKDVDILRGLGAKILEIANSDEQEQKRRMWTRLNRLEDVRPMVWLNEFPTWELDKDPELALHCENEYCRGLEKGLRFQLYWYAHMRVDHVLDPFIVCPFVYHDSGYGLGVEAKRSNAEGVTAIDYIPAIREEQDIEKIQIPKIAADWTATEENFQQMSELFGDAIPVIKRGVTNMWCAPWDTLIMWYGVTEMFMDMIDRPRFVHQAIGRVMDALCARLDQLEDQGLLSLSDGNVRVGSGGLGITDELPHPGDKPGPVTPMDQWGSSTGQIFSEVSAEMHDEFCLQYELRWLRRFGLNCYGCCEQLHHKMHILKQIPRLRRVSMSNWIDKDKAVEAVGRDYVFSCKPNPAIFATEVWDPEAARRELITWLEPTRGLHVEIIMKDISTCQNEPRRLWEWCDLASQLAEEYA